MSKNSLEISPLMTIPAYLVGEVKSKLAYVDEHIMKAEITSAGDKIILHLDIEANEGLNNRIVTKIQRVVQALVKGAFKLKVQVLEDFIDRPVPCSIDPMPELLRRSELSQEALGIFVLGPLLTRLVAYLERRFIELADSFGAQPYRFPTLIPARFLERVKYFSAFPHSLTFATHLRTDLDAIDHFANQAVCDEQGLNVPPEMFAQVNTLLSPAVCYHLYFALAGKPLKDGQLIATAVGNCFRYEASNLISLERLWNFTMREVIFVGTKDFVLDHRELGRLRMNKVFEEMGLAYRVESANDPFFIGEFRRQAAFQSAFQLKYEIRARLPFKDPPSVLKTDYATLAVGSYNYHQDFFGRNLDISLPDGSPAHTGCIAFGLERMAFALLSQYGLEMKSWPASIRKALM